MNQQTYEAGKRSEVGESLKLPKDDETRRTLSREQVLLAKRAAMKGFFYIPAAQDDDNGFDRLMAMRSREEIDAASKGLESSGWGGIYLEETWKRRELEFIQRSVLKDALRLISVLCRVSPETALAQVREHRTTYAPNDGWTHIGNSWDISHSAVTGCAESQSRQLAPPPYV